jgi:hypothetical protein
MIQIDTSTNEAKYQPIDLRIKFDNKCWAINETKHSVRIGYDDGYEITEIESQIYDLNRVDEKTIDACSIVFLIPEGVNVDEKYYIFYSDIETTQPNYKNHLSILDTHYFYEPISGQIIDFDYYQIIEEEYIIYGICQQGELLGNGMSNSVIKLKPNSTEFETVNAEQIASFSMTYSINPIGEFTGSQWANNVKKSILVDGNLMIRLRIEGNSPNNELKSDNIYTYYYRPTPTKSLHVNVNHDILKSINVEGNKEREGTYASLSTIKARSATIEKMNIGDILPFIHFYSEDERVKEYTIPIDPDSDPAEWILSATDDDDLGSKAWMCMDDKESGQTHGLIFESNTGFIEGVNDGIQVKSSVHQHVKLPGLEADSGDLFAVRNAYEDNQHNLVINDDINVIFNVEFITFQKGGFESIAMESDLYRNLIKDRPIYRGNDTEDEADIRDRYTLTAYLHNAPSFPMGSMLSAALGRNISYITIELYRDNKLASSGSAGKLPIGSLELDFEDTNLIQKIRLVFNIFDWRNFSIFKKLRFPDLDEGIYLIKVFKENPFLKKDRQYIGFSIVELTEDSSVRINCRSQGSAEFSILDSNDNGIKDVKFLLKSDDVIIASNISNEDGFVTLNAPRIRNNPYTLNVIYKGFLVETDDIVFGLNNIIRPYSDIFSISLYSIDIIVRDKLDLPIAVNINPILTSSNMVEEYSFNSEITGDGEFFISGLYPEEYTLKMSYKSFEAQQKIAINMDKKIEIIFPAEYTVNLNCMDSYGYSLDDGGVILERDGKKISESIQKSSITEIKIPPGFYSLSVELNNEEIAKQNIEIKADKNLNIITSQDSSFHINLTYFSVLIILFSIILILWKRNTKIGLKILSIGLIILAIVQPWWILNGDDGSVATSTNTYLFPSKIITKTSTQNLFGGEISLVPEEFTMVLELILLILILAVVIIAIQIFIDKRFRKINFILSIISTFLIIFSIILFYIAMSEVTKVGVGSFSGDGLLSVSLPGLQQNVDINCNWGFGLGLYLVLISMILNLFFIITKFIKNYNLNFLRFRLKL